MIEGYALTVNAGNAYALDVETTNEAYALEADHVTVIMPETYAGAYTITPTQETQTIPVAGYKMADNFTVEPIPNNYGLITWNGACILIT